jgi:hypothetical protein
MEIDKIRRTFFWQGGDTKKKISFGEMDQDLQK